MHPEAAYAEARHRGALHLHERFLVPAAQHGIVLAAPARELTRLFHGSQDLVERGAARVEIAERRAERHGPLADGENTRMIGQAPGERVAHAPHGPVLDHERPVGRRVPPAARGNAVQVAHGFDVRPDENRA